MSDALAFDEKELAGFGRIWSDLVGGEAGVRGGTHPPLGAVTPVTYR
jgi:hypothetical protein